MSAFKTILRRFGIGRAAPSIAPTGPVEPYSYYRPLWPTAAEAVRKNIALLEQLGVAEPGRIDVDALVSQHQPKHWDGAMDQTIDVLGEWMIDEGLMMPRLVVLEGEPPRSPIDVLRIVSTLATLDAIEAPPLRSCATRNAQNGEPACYLLTVEGVTGRHEIAFRTDDVDDAALRKLLLALEASPKGFLAIADFVFGTVIAVMDDDALDQVNAAGGGTGEVFVRLHAR